MNINIVESKKILTVEVLQKFEDTIGVQLPSEYKEFLLLHNGGILEPDMGFKFKSQIKNIDESMIGLFYSLYDGEYGSLLKEFNNYQQYVADDMLIIASDPGSGLILLGISGEKQGKVYFWMQDFEPVGEYESECKTFALVADSFNEFLSSLTEVE